jgi:hypothetical protein
MRKKTLSLFFTSAGDLAVQTASFHLGFCRRRIIAAARAGALPPVQHLPDYWCQEVEHSL